MGCGGDPAWSENGCDIEEENVPKAHHAAKLRDNFSMGLSQAFSPPVRTSSRLV